MPWTEPAPSLTVTTPRGRWNNALAMELESKRLRQWPAADGLLVACRVRVREGRVGIGLTKEDGSTYASRERMIPAKPGIQCPRVWVDEPSQARFLVFRNVDPQGRPSHFDLFDLFADRLPGEGSFAASWEQPSVKTIDVGELGRLVAWARRSWDDPFPARPFAASASQDARAGSIGIVDAADLPALYGQPSPPGAASVRRGQAARSLEDGDRRCSDSGVSVAAVGASPPPRVRDLGRIRRDLGGAEHRRRMNLPQGETGGDRRASSDAGASIGWRYRAAGLEGRVHQLLCDSRDFETNGFAADFFDTVLIDGGHTPDLVENDTDKALRVLRPGGLCIWHDFCPDAAALSRNLAPLGVVQAIVENIGRWRPLFERLYWIRKSWILVGERKPR